ncbi:MAG: UDP-N-acetylglucosamine 2-epimerase [Phycisphaerae bacterium]|nr:UDP-N-acetylglucosamine 2-epimerase [Phycisphaerae bacterium]
MGRRRVIAAVTGSRAEFGLLRPVLAAISRSGRLRLRLIVAGSHLTSGTWRDIQAAGLTIDARVPMQVRGRVGRAADVEAVARGVRGIGRAFGSLQPDFVLVLGDRVEAFAAATAASVGGFRIAHVHGGDRAEGVVDESLRHAISKLAHLHLAATTTSRRRLVRMGEDPPAVVCVGSPAVDGLAKVGPDPDGPEVIVLQHPVGEADRQERTWMEQTLAATRRFDRVVMAPNADPGATGIRRAIAAEKVQVIEHLPRDRWLSMLAGARAIVGNSSAGLIEAAVLRTPAVNVGPRQAGREKPGHVVDCDYGRGRVTAALGRALAADLRRLRHPYGDGRSGPRMAKLLASVRLDAMPLRKHNAY